MKKTTKQSVTELTKRVEKLERQNQTPKPSDEQARMEAAQEAHEAALASHNTKLQGGIRYSLNSALTPTEREALLKKLEKEQ